MPQVLIESKIILAKEEFSRGVGFMGAIIYLTQFNQQVYGADATTSGLMLLPMIAGLAVVSIITGRLVSRVGYYKWPMVWGFSIATLSMFLLSYLNADTPYWFEAIIIAMMGMGMGASMPIINIAIQNEFPQSEQGVAASMSFFASITFPSCKFSCAEVILPF